MFQVGRSTESVIDMVIIDDELDDRGTIINPDIDKLSCSSTISRFACRITAERKFPYNLRLFAGGFDENNQISLGQHAPKIIKPSSKLEIDGLTTNGVLIKKPEQEWLEVSVNGNCHKLRETRSCMKAGGRSSQDTNILVDNTLIDLCGCMLLYRSPEYVSKINFLRNNIELMVENFNQEKPQCPVRMSTLRINPHQHTIRRPDKRNPQQFLEYKQQLKSEATWPFVYLGCGHIHSYHDWDGKKNRKRDRGNQASSAVNGAGYGDGTGAQNGTQNSNFSLNQVNSQNQQEKLIAMKSRTCPLCRQDSRFTQIKLGNEPAFYKLDSGKKLPTEINEATDLIKFDEILSDQKDENENQIQMTNGHQTKISGEEDNYDTSANHGESQKNENAEREELNYIFNPCGHMTTEKTANYWSDKTKGMFVLQGTSKKHHVCPFCLVVLNERNPIQKLFIDS